MALGDFLRRPAGNSIEALPPPEPAKATAGSGNTASAAGDAPPPAPPEAPARKPLPVSSEPASIAASYYVEAAADRRTYYQDYQRKSVAFTATDTRVTSAREDLRTVRDMVEVAGAQGWRSVQLRGTETFRREAWIEAAAAGLNAAGYKASDPDRQEVERRRTERDQGRPSNALPRIGAVAGVAKEAAAATRPGSRAVPGGAAAADDPSPSVVQPRAATPAEQRRAFGEASAGLSDDGKLILAALSEKIDRQMNRYNSDAKAELKLFVATELGAREQSQGPVQLSAEQRRLASTPEVGRATGRETGATLLSPERTATPTSLPPAPSIPAREQEQPRLTRSR
ncbi:hypothetical protein IP88_04220 [alpha proteobacterium AAP81b]|nr:hypothetical protein IP88_04220 [alpha proteobacterium AAP81b]